jgi:hypothetical protein
MFDVHFFLQSEIHNPNSKMGVECVKMRTEMKQCLGRFMKGKGSYDFVKSLSAALRCILSHCGIPVSTPHSFVFARLAYETFYFVV